MGAGALAVALDPVLTQVQKALVAANAKGSVPLDATTLEPTGDGSGKATVALIGATIGAAPTLAGATIAQVSGEDALLVEGTARGSVLGIPGAHLAATFTTVADAELPSGLELQAVIEIACGTKWVLTDSFPHLAGSSLAKATLDPAVAPAFVLRSADDLAGADAYGPVERRGLNLELGAVMDGSGPFGLLGTVLSGVSGTLRMAGPVRIGAALETVELRAPSGVPSAALPVPGLAPISLADSAVVVRASAAVGFGVWSQEVALEVWARVAIGGGTVPLGVGIAIGGSEISLFVVPDQGVRLFEMLEFIPGFSFLEAVPAEVQNVVNERIDTFAIRLGGGPGGWSLRSLQAIVSSPQAWTIVPGAVEIERITVSLYVSWPGAVVTGTVEGVIGLDPVDGKPAVEIAVAVPIPLGSAPISISSHPGVELPGLGALTTLIGGAELTASLPAGVEKVGSFVLEMLLVEIELAGSPAVSRAAIGLTAKSWPFVSGRLELNQIVVQLELDLRASTELSGEIGGTLVLGGAHIEVLVDRARAAPHWELSVTATGVVLPSLEELTALADAELAKLLPQQIATNHFEISNLDLEADLSQGKLELFEIAVESEESWPIVPGRFEIEQLGASLTIDSRSGASVSSGDLRAVLDFGKTVYLGLEAQLPPNGNWLLSGKLERPVDVGKLVELALGPAYAADLPGKIEIKLLALSYEPATGKYAFAVAASWVPPLEAVQLELDAGLELERRPEPGKPGSYQYLGHVEGDLKAHFGSDQLELAVVYAFQPGKNSFVFRLGFNQLTLTATYAKLAGGDETITARLAGISFGELIEWLVSLVDPDLHFELSAPWDALDKIKFEDFAIVGNLTQRTIGVTYEPKLDIGVADVQAITLTYLHKGGSGTIEIEIAGSFLGESYPPEKPLKWDLLNDPPPASPGAGAAAFELQDLGVGQHVVLAGPSAKTMPQVMQEVHEVIASTGGKKPWQQLDFDADAGWLLAADFTVMGTLRLRLIFADPQMYGVEISLAGEKAGIFAGLEFQILYRKVSDDVGVYHIELKLPDAMRHLEMGEVSLTLPIVVLDIYTDGGFYIDLGFPYNENWTVCFGVQAFPFIGLGGFYVGRLTAADGAAEIVPAIDNGSFGPVIEFGVALALGVGKTFQEGPLSAGVSVTAQGVLQGVVAWFNPSDASLPSSRYFKVNGSLAIVGKLYGSVDFKVISVSVSLVVTVSASVQVEACAPVLIGISASVEVEASIKILFIRIHFHFSMHLDASFKIGSQQATPWHLSAASGTAPGRGRALSPAAARRAEPGAHELAGPAALLVAAVGGAPAIDWQPVPLGARQLLEVTMLPVLTIAPDPASGKNVLTVAMVPSMDAPQPEAASATATSYDRLLQALVRWGLRSLDDGLPERATAVDLLLVYEDLTGAGIGSGGFAYANVAAFLEANFAVALAAPAGSGEEVPGAVLPMPPPLKMSPAGQPAVEFWTATPVEAAWQEGVRELFERLAVDTGYNRAPDPAAAPEPAPEVILAGEPLAEALFGDWALLVARGAVQAAADALAKGSRPAGAADSLVGLAWELAAGGLAGDGRPLPLEYRSRAGDTAASVAALFGVTAAALAAANPGVDWAALAPGTELRIPVPMALADYVTVPGDSAAKLAAAWICEEAALKDANSGVDWDALAAGTPLRIPVPAALFDLAAANLGAELAAGSLPIAGLSCQSVAGDSLLALAQRCGQGAGQVGGLAAANAAAAGLLLPGAAEPLVLAAAAGTIPYTIAAGDGPALVAAFAYVRNRARLPDPLAADQDWFASSISQENPLKPLAGQLEAGLELTIPLATASPNGPQPTGQTTTYATKAGDTLELVAGCFAMTELHAGELAALEAEIATLNPGLDWTKVGTTIQLPPQAHAIVAGDTLKSLAARFGLGVAEVAARPENQAAKVIAPNVAVALPADLLHTVAAGTRLADLAAGLGLGVDELVGRIGAITGALAPSPPISLPNRSQMELGELLEGVSGAATANVAGMASHFTLHGLRLPVPPDPKNPVNEALYALTGQQFPAPSLQPGEHSEIGFEVGDGSAWVYPVSGYETTAADTRQSLEAKYGAVVVTLNPQVDWGSLAAGTKLQVPAAGLALQLDQATLAAEAPVPPATVQGEAVAVPLVEPRPARHLMAAPVPWVAALPPQPPPSPQAPPRPSGGGLSLWRLPPSLVSKVAAAPEPHPYGLMTAPAGQPLAGEPQQAGYYAWATWLPVKLRRLPAPGGGWIEGTYLVLGADQVDREALFGLWTALGEGEGVQLSLAYPAAAAGAGLVSDALDPQATAVLKVNLSTETHSGGGLRFEREGEEQGAAEGDVPPDAYAELGTPTRFLQLLWEASVVGSGGYYLTYSKADGGGGLPSSVWASGEEASLYLVALLDPALAAAPDRRLYPFATGAVVAGSLDPEKLDVFAQASDGSDLTAVAAAPPGNLAFRATTPAAEPAKEPSGEERARSLFSLLAYSVSGAGFEASPLTLPLGPTAAGASWEYDRTLAVYRLAQSAADMAPGLPPGAGDPYAGIAAGAAVDVSLAFRDVFGNEIGQALPALEGVEVGYYDPVRGLSAWPSASSSYAVTGTAGAPLLELGVDLGLRSYVPSAATPFAVAVRAAAAHQAVYGQVHYQLQQPDVSVSVATSLDPGGGALAGGGALEGPLRGLAMASYLYLGTAREVRQLEHLAAATETLGGVAAAYSLSAGELLAANAGADASQLVDGALTAPVLHVFTAADTLAAVAAAAGLPAAAELLHLNQAAGLSAGVALLTAAWSFAAPAGSTLTTIGALEDLAPVAVAVANTETAGILEPGQKVSFEGTPHTIAAPDTFGTLASGFGTTVAALAAQNLTVPLFKAGAGVMIAPVALPAGESGGARTHLTAAGETLAGIARAQRCTVAGLGLANGQLAMLDESKSVEVDGTTVPIRDGTLATVAADLLGKGVAAGIGEVAAALADPAAAAENALLAGIELAIPDYVIQPGDTVETVMAAGAGAFTLARLGLLNGPAPGVYPGGTALITGTRTVTPAAGESFAALAAGLGLTLDQLGAASGGAGLQVGKPLAIPGAVSLGTTRQAAFQVPFGAGANQSPAAVAAAFATKAATLGGLNATMPGLVAAGVEVLYAASGGKTKTAAGDTLATVAARVGAAGAEDLLADATVAALALIAPGALLQCPLPSVAGRSLNALAAALGVDPADLASANEALAGLLAPNQAVVAQHRDPATGKVLTASAETRAEDTIGALLRRLQQQVAAIGLADLLAACGESAALLADVEAIVPPARVAAALPFGAAEVGTPFTPLEVTVTIARDPALVDPAASEQGLTEAVSATTALAPDFDGLGGPQGFAAAFDAALAALRLKLAIGPVGEGERRLWVVDLGAGGFSRIEVEGAGQRFYALAPVSRELLSGTAAIRLYEPASGKLAANPVNQGFSAVDADAWMRTALEAVDLFLAPPVAAAAFRLEAAALDAVVEAKAAIATALRQQVAEVLVDASPDPEGLEAAREALYQSMLVSLESAYTTDAVVQLPLAVDSPFGPAYTTGENDTFATVAAAYGVSLEAAEAEFAAVAPGGAFPPATRLPQSAMHRTTSGGDTFASLAAFFGAEPGAVGVAALDLAGLVPAGTPIGSYAVAPGEALRAFAAATGLSAAAIAAQLAQRGVALTPGLEVRCFSAANPIAPRLSGRAAVERYLAAPGNDAAELLAWFRVSAAALGEAVAEMKEILRVGTVVENAAGTTYEIAAGDTFQSLCSPLGAADVGALLPILRTELPGESLLAPGVAVALSRQSRQPTAADSFATLAARFEEDAGSFAVANEGVASVFAPGAVLTLSTGASYEVKGVESIAEVSAALKTTPKLLAGDPGVEPQQGVFNPHGEVFGISAQPDFSLSTAKAPLVDGTAFVSFLFATGADARLRNLPLRLAFDVSELEFEIAPVAAAPGYQESEWLRFGVPLDQPPPLAGIALDAGQVEIPIALRAYPQLPLMQSLEARAAWPAPRTILEAKQWYASAAVAQTSAAQDETLLEVSFGAGAGEFGPDVVSTLLFEKLAQLVTAWPALRHDVAALGESGGGGADGPRLAQAAASFATLVGELAAALGAGAELGGDGDGGEAQVYTFLLDPTYDVGDRYLKTLELALQEGSSEEAIPWPAIWVTTAGGKPLRLEAEPGSGRSRRYEYPAGKVEAFTPLTHTFAFPGSAVPADPEAGPAGRDAVAWQQGQVKVAVRRNAELVPDLPTAPEFVYQTPWISFTNPAVPLLQAEGEIDLAAGSGFEARLAAALEELLSGEHGPLAGSYDVRLLCRYELPLVAPVGVEGGAPLVELLPVFYVPLWSLSAGKEVTGFAATAAAQAQSWLVEQGLTPSAGDAYLLDLSIFAAGDGELSRPLVELSGLRIAAA
jgi:LysM repeat protein